MTTWNIAVRQIGKRDSMLSDNFSILSIYKRHDPLGKLDAALEKASATRLLPLVILPISGTYE